MGRRGLTPGLALGFWGSLARESELAQRVGRILAGGGKMKAGHARLVLGGAMLALVAGAVGLPRCPQVIGFASNYSASSYSSASRVADRLASGTGMAGFRAESVVYRPETGNGMLRLDPTHRDGAAMNGAQSGASGAVANHRIVAQTHVSEAGHGAPGLVTDQPRAGNWVVVTAWDGAGVSRAVLGSAEAPDEGSAARQESAPAERGVYEQRVYRYAAVPVRGGWLVIQL